MIQQETDNYNSENMDFFFLILISLLRQVQEDRCIYRAKKRLLWKESREFFLNTWKLRLQKLKQFRSGTSMLVQWLRLLCSQCKGPGFHPWSGN